MASVDVASESNTYAWVHEARLTTAGSNVTLSYAEAILMARASGTKMYDEKGREWLDCVNNVAHVGHGAPSVRSVVHPNCTITPSSTSRSLLVSSIFLEFPHVFELTKFGNLNCFQ
jgi:4-aminobutyrate aminotransferase-like enzyme